MPNIAWRCVRESDGDVKFAARMAHVEKLVDKGYVCTLDPDLDFDTLTLEPEQFSDYEPPYVEPEPELTTTLDPLTLGPGLTLSNGDLTVENAGTESSPVVRSVTSRTSDKVYWEATIDTFTAGVSWCDYGMTDEATVLEFPDYPGSSSSIGFSVELADWDGLGGVYFRKPPESSGWYEPYPPSAEEVVVYTAVELSTGKVWCRLSTASEWIGGGDPSTDTLPTLTYGGAGEPMVIASAIVGAKLTFNFGATPFNGVVPTGFVSWDEGA